MSLEEFERVRQEPEPLRRARLATDLISTYQQRSVELARLRRDAINDAADAEGMTFTAVAAALGLSKGRVTQIRQSAPPRERGLFGVGPVTVAVPERVMEGRALPVISAEDTTAAENLTALLAALAFQVESARVPAVGEWAIPAGDVIAICGPKSSPTIAAALAADPRLSFEEVDGRWVITERDTGRVHTSPMDHDRDGADVAYFGRLIHDGRPLLVIAGVHAVGSLGVVHYLTHHVRDIYDQVGDVDPFSMVIRSHHEGTTITTSEAACAPRPHLPAS